MSALSPGDGEAPADSELATLRGAVSVTAPFVPTCENRQRAEQPGRRRGSSLRCLETWGEG